VQIGDSIIAKVNEAGASFGDWLILQGNVVTATDEVEGIVRLATQEEVDAGTEGGAVVLTPATFESSQQLSDLREDKLSRDGSQAMTADLNVGNHKVINVLTPTSDNDAANKDYVDTAASTAQSNAEATASADATAKANAAQAAAESYADGLSVNYDAAGSAATAQANAETFATNAANTAQSNAEAFATTAANQALTDANSYTDTGLALKLDLAGGVLSGSLNMDGNEIQGALLNTATLSNSLDANANTISKLAEPTSPQDAATKSYVDTQLGSAVFSGIFADTAWTLAGGVYSLEVVHDINSSTPKVSSYVSGNLVEFAVVVIDANTIELKSNIAAPASVSVGVSK
jgi:hypothetical protein